MTEQPGNYRIDQAGGFVGKYPGHQVPGPRIDANGNASVGSLSGERAPSGLEAGLGILKAVSGDGPNWVRLKDTWLDLSSANDVRVDRAKNKVNVWRARTEQGMTVEEVPNDQLDALEVRLNEMVARSAAYWKP